MAMVVTDNDASGSVTLDIHGRLVEISAYSPEYGEAYESIDVQAEGNPVNISFNPKYLQDPMKVLTCDQFLLRFNTSNTPVQLTGDEGFIYILMPMRQN